jgi:hypothetical protein
VDDDLPSFFLVGDAKVVVPGKARLRFCNNGLFPSAARNVKVRLLPVEKRPSRMPEVKFDLEIQI